MSGSKCDEARCLVHILDVDRVRADFIPPTSAAARAAVAALAGSRGVAVWRGCTCKYMPLKLSNRGWNFEYCTVECLALCHTYISPCSCAVYKSKSRTQLLRRQWIVVALLEARV